VKIFLKLNNRDSAKIFSYLSKNKYIWVETLVISKNYSGMILARIYL